VYKGGMDNAEEIKAFVAFHKNPVALLVKKGDKVQ
jgi:uncharacterized protein (DUF427 family)